MRTGTGGIQRQRELSETEIGAQLYRSINEASQMSTNLLMDQYNRVLYNYPEPDVINVGPPDPETTYNNGVTYNDIFRTNDIRTPGGVFDIPPGVMITGYEYRRINGTIAASRPNPPDINDRLCARIMDANGAMIHERLIIECVASGTYGNQGVGVIWAGYMAYASLIQMNGVRRVTTDITPRFMDAIILVHPDIPDGDDGYILFYHIDRSYRRLDIRLTNFLLSDQ